MITLLISLAVSSSAFLLGALSCAKANEVSKEIDRCERYRFDKLKAEQERIRRANQQSVMSNMTGQLSGGQQQRQVPVPKGKKPKKATKIEPQRVIPGLNLPLSDSAFYDDQRVG